MRGMRGKTILLCRNATRNASLNCRGRFRLLSRRWNSNANSTHNCTKQTEVKLKKDSQTGLNETQKQKSSSKVNVKVNVKEPPPPKGGKKTTCNCTSRDDRKRIEISAFQYGVATLFMTGIGTSLYSRRWRKLHLDEIPLARDCDAFYIPGATSTSQDVQQSASVKRKHVQVQAQAQVRRDLHELDSLIARTGLMGKSVPGSKSVKEELNIIRQWHQDRGFEGGVVLRELTKPLFDGGNGNGNGNGNGKGNENGRMVMEGGDDVEPMPAENLPQRECYYLYYEIKDNGHALQQIFCRGTTLFADVKTCLESYLVYDEEMGIHLHKGFRDHALRLVNDVEPLLGHPNNPRATVEVSGHSLGGAVAMIAAMLLKKRGYNVQKVLSVAGARFCSKDGAERVIVDKLLPLDALRIEDDFDCVPFLPPWARSAGDKLWLVNDNDDNDVAEKEDVSATTDENDSHEHGSDLSSSPSPVRYIPRSTYLEKDNALSWTDVIFTNLRLPETVANELTTHTIRSHRAKVSHLMEELKSSQQWLQEQSIQDSSVHTPPSLTAKIGDE